MKSENTRICNFFVPIHTKKFVLKKFSGFQFSLHSQNSKSDTEIKDIAASFGIIDACKQIIPISSFLKNWKSNNLKIMSWLYRLKTNWER